MNSEPKTVVLGPEYDGVLIGALMDVLQRLGYVRVSHSWGVGGSQEVETAEFVAGDRHLLVENETYMGLSICGPGDLVDSISEMVADEMRKTGSVP